MTIEREISDFETPSAAERGGDVASVALAQIADRGQLVAMLRAAQRRQELIANFAKAALAPIALDRLLQEATVHIREGLGVELAMILQHVPATADLLVTAGVGWKMGVVGGARLAADSASPAGQAFRTLRPVLIDDLGDAASLRTPSLLADHRVVSLVNVPIYVNGRAWGVLEADSSLPRDFTALDVDFLATFAGILGAAILRKTVEDQAETALSKLASLADQRQVLLGELQHRVKNNLQIILALISMQQRQTKEPELARSFTYIADRVSAIALAHDHLTMRDNLGAVKIGAYLRALCSYIDPAREGVTIEADAVDIELPLEQAVPIGLIVNEAVTNALKHAFAGRRTGVVRVRFATDPGLRRAKLEIADDGPGLGEARAGTGQGLIQALARQINGVADTFTAPEGGAIVEVGFPLRAMCALSRRAS